MINNLTNTSINKESLIFEDFLRKNKLFTINRDSISSLNFLDRDVAYVLYGIKKGIPRLERIYIDHNQEFNIKVPLMNISFSYLKSEHSLNINEHIKFNETLINQIDSIIYKAQKQIYPFAPFLVNGYFYDGGLRMEQDINDLKNYREQVSRKFGVIFFKESGGL